MLLSICIPTHDGRAWTLRETIDSVLPQIVGHYDGVAQICVSDNGSRDETAALLAEFAAAYPGVFTLHRFEENLGGHNNFLKVVEIAGGEYCWLLGSDDKLYPGAVDRIIAALRQHPQVAGITFDYQSFDRTLTVEEPTWTSRCRPARPPEFLYENRREALAELGLFLMFMSIHVFRREDWQAVVAGEGREGVFAYRHYMHVYIIGQAMRLGQGGWLWLASALVMRRNYNDSLVDELQCGMHRYFIETSEDLVHCYAGLAGTDTALYQDLVRRYFRHWFSPRTVADWKRRPDHTAETGRAIFNSVRRTHGFLPTFWLIAAPRLLIPESFYKARMQLGLGTRLRQLAPMLAARLKPFKR